jgi:2-amino-4-hydroxy-6-hydroxymethyldihydropteridine diphosphokinase
MKAWIGLGSNIGDGPAEIKRALGALAAHPSMALLRRSPVYRTAPWGVRDQADFHNAVAEVNTELEPLPLLAALQQMEARLGRKPARGRWQPRRIDLDLLLLEDRIYFLPGLTVPHPRMHRRAFVLAPLAAIEPSLVIPGRGTVQSCLSRLAPQGIERVQEKD